jgi:hypothetical protein
MASAVNEKVFAFFETKHGERGEHAGLRILVEDDGVVGLNAAELPGKRQGTADVVTELRRALGDDPQILVIDVI